MALACACPTLVDALEDCGKQLAIIDQRIAQATQSESRLQVARQLRAALAQSCSVLDERTANQMLARLDEVLPPQSPREVQAERRAGATLEAAKRELQALQKATAAQEAPERAAGART